MKNLKICQYCGKKLSWVSGKKVYPGNAFLGSKTFYMCSDCDAWVGCVPGSVKPLGTVAKGPLRQLRFLAHKHFDKLWKYEGLTRSQAYNWLSQKLDIPESLCHIGLFDEEACEKVIEICKNLKT